MDYDDKITEIEELTKIVFNDKSANDILDLIYKKCEELKKILKNYYIE